jgi:hypothetical protein
VVPAGGCDVVEGVPVWTGVVVVPGVIMLPGFPVVAGVPVVMPGFPVVLGVPVAPVCVLGVPGELPGLAPAVPGLPPVVCAVATPRARNITNVVTKHFCILGSPEKCQYRWWW